MKMKNKNMKRKKVFGAIVSIILLIMVSSTFLLENTAQGSPGDFTYHKLVIINNIYVNQSLDNFPVLISTTDTDLQGLQSDGGDIAFYSYDNTTQYNHEIEYFNSATGELVAWVNVTHVYANTDTKFWMYYGNPTIANQENPTGTWDSNYVLVLHMDGATYDAIDDSTSNNNDVTEYMGTPTFQQQGVAKYGVEFSGAGSNDVLTIPNSPSLNFSAEDFTVEVFLNTTDRTQQQYAFCRWHVGGALTEASYMVGVKVTSGRVRGRITNDGGGSDTEVLSTSAISSNEWNHLAIGLSNTNDKFYAFHNGTDVGVSNFVGNVYANNYNFTIGAFMDNNADPGSEVLGVLDEIRISNILRNTSWLGATYNTTVLSDQFISFGSETSPSPPSSFTLKGLQGDGDPPSTNYGNITWVGDNGTRLWSNETQQGGWLEINMSINSTDNVSEIRIYVDDIGSMGASNITIYVSSDNSSFGVPLDNPSGKGNGIFPDGGGNISLSDSTWDASTMGINPFAGGLTNTNTSIWCIFSLDVPSTIGAGTYTQNDWKVYIGIET